MIFLQMRLVFTLSLICCFFTVFGGQEERWELWKQAHQKTYSSASEEEYRKNIFYANCDAIDAWNQKYKDGEVTFSMGENKYSDHTEDEYDRLKGTRLSEDKIEANVRQSSIPKNQRNVKDACAVDLREDYCLIGVKDQGDCGSCYAFPATALAEYAFCKQTSIPVSFSEQQCMDCTSRLGNQRCEGGLYARCFEHWRKHLIQTSSAYPYQARNQTCQEYKTRGVTTVIGYKNLTLWDETRMLKTLCKYKQPLAVAIDASNLFDHYKSGVFDDPICSNYLRNGSTYANHAVTIVGAGVENDGTKYWIVRNSWGTTWGDEGYIKMKRGVNQCNIALDPVAINQCVGCKARKNWFI